MSRLLLVSYESGGGSSEGSPERRLIRNQITEMTKAKAFYDLIFHRLNAVS
jgi:hypothetical protein